MTEPLDSVAAASTVEDAKAQPLAVPATGSASPG